MNFISRLTYSITFGLMPFYLSIPLFFNFNEGLILVIGACSSLILNFFLLSSKNNFERIYYSKKDKYKNE